jgi:hypothetical protein
VASVESIELRLPERAGAWDQLFERPLRFAPWPYTEPELTRIRDALPDRGADVAIIKSIFAARQFLAGEYLRRRDNAPRKSDPRNELERILEASRELRTAVLAASLDAIRHLADHPSPGLGNSPVRLRDVSIFLHRFEHDNRFAFRDLPERDMMGAPATLREEAFVYQLWISWRVAHAKRSPTRGWPSFRTACVSPLRDLRFPKELRPADRIERAWQKVLHRARVRFEGVRKSPE